MSSAARKARKAAGIPFERDVLTPAEIAWPSPPALVVMRFPPGLSAEDAGADERPRFEVAYGKYRDVFYLRPEGETGPVRMLMKGQLQREFESAEERVVFRG